MPTSATAGDELPEQHSVRHTESASSVHSDVSTTAAAAAVPSFGRPKIYVACVLDTGQPENVRDRRCALDELRQACSLVGANFLHVQVHFSIVFIPLQRTQQSIKMLYYSSNTILYNIFDKYDFFYFFYHHSEQYMLFLIIIHFIVL